MSSLGLLNKSLSFLLICLLAILTFPIIPAWVPQLQKAWLVLILLLVVYLCISRRIGWGKSTICLFVYALVVLFNAKMGDQLIPSMSIGVMEILFLYVPSAVALWGLTNNRIDIIKTVLLISLIFLVLEAISSFFIVKAEPGIIRTLYKMSTDEGDSSLMFVYYRLGLLDYSMAHAVPILIPPLFCAYKRLGKSLWNRAFFIAVIGICLFLTWLSDSTTALMLAILFIIIGAITRVSSFASNARWLFVVLIVSTPLIISDKVQLATLDMAESILGKESVFAEKIDEFRYSVNNEDMTGDMQGRVDRYNKSISLFVNSPIWGSNSKPGNHAALIDRLGSLGLLGFIPLMLFFMYVIKDVSRYLSHKSLTFYYEGIFAGFIMLATKGMWVWPIFFNLLILLPFLLYYIDDRIYAKYR